MLKSPSSDRDFIEKIRSSDIGLRLEDEAESGRLATKRAAIAEYDAHAARGGARIREAESAVAPVAAKLAEARKKLAAVQSEMTILHYALLAERGGLERDLAELRGNIARAINPNFRAICARFRAEIERLGKLPGHSREEKGSTRSPLREGGDFYVEKIYSTRPKVAARISWFECAGNFITDLVFSDADDGDLALERAEAHVWDNAPPATGEMIAWERGKGPFDSWTLRDACGKAGATVSRQFETARQKFEQSERDRAKNQGTPNA